MGYGDKSLKSQMKRADKLKSKTVLILGENEINERTAELRDMTSGTQEKVSLEDFDKLAEVIKDRVSKK